MKTATFLPKVATKRCSGCGRCVAACPDRLFTLETAGYRKYAVLLSPACYSSCLSCVAACPMGALVHTER
jgi:NAD-dependent dihydropyrimidine dehydrogenase PreA subunit